MRLIVGLVLLTACNETTLRATNRAPSAVITAPASTATLIAGEPVRLEGGVSDADNRTTELTTTWIVGGAPRCEAEAPEDGSVSCLIDAVPAGTSLDVTLEVKDPRGSRGVDSVSWRVAPKAAPTIEILQPLASDRLYAELAITLDTLSQLGADDPSTLTVTWRSSVDGELAGGTGTPDSAGRASGSTMLTAGQHALTATVTDVAGQTGSDAVNVIVGPPNTQPDCIILAPEDGALAERGLGVDFRGLATDVDQPSTGLSATWTSDRDGLLSSTPPATNGNLLFTSYTLSRGAHVVTLEVADEAGGRCTDTVTIGVSDAPTLSLILPVDAALFRTGDSIVFEAQVSDAEDAATDIDLVWSTDVDGVISDVDADSSGFATFTSASLTTGPHTLTVAATDTSGLTTTRLRTFRINTPPAQPTVSIAPDPATTTSPLTASASSSDADGDTVSFSWTWSRGGAVQPGQTSPSLSPSATAKHQVWTATATPTDGHHTGAPSDASVTIQNSPPVLSSVTISPRTAVASGMTLTCSAPASDPDGDPLIRGFTWTDSGGAVVGTSHTWVVAGIAHGDSVTCTATVDDGDGGTDQASDTVTVANSPPVVTRVTLNPPSGPTTVTTVTCDAQASDVDGDVPTLAYAWTDGAGTPLGSGPTLDLSTTGVRIGDTITCTATATDDQGATGSGTASAAIADPFPSISGVAIVVRDGGPPQARSTLDCTWSGYANPQGDPDQSTVAWSVNGSAAGTGPSLSGVFVRGQTVVCEVTPSDGVSAGAPLSDSVLIQDTPPSIASVTISPVRPVVTDTLTCAYADYDDADGDPDASTLAWAVDGLGQPGGSATLSSGYGNSSIVTCTVTPTTSAGTSGAAIFDTVVINSAPDVPPVIITPPVPGILHELACSVPPPGATDPEGDPLVYDLTWFRDGSPAGYAGTVLEGEMVPVPSSETAGGETWRCEAIADDGQLRSGIGSAEVTITCPVASGQEEACPAESCADVLDSGQSYGDGPYWIDPGAGPPYQVTCDMTGDGGGWMLVMQTSAWSAYDYGSAVWTDTSGGASGTWDVSVDQDNVSQAFYELPATETRLCMPRLSDDVEVCATMSHAELTPRDLANEPPIFTWRLQQGQMPLAFEGIPGSGTWSADYFQRWGWSHGTSVCGGLRIGFSGDRDSTDSRDSAIGIGIHSFDTVCNPLYYAGLTAGSGYYHHPWPGQPTPAAAPLPAKVWIR